MNFIKENWRKMILMIYAIFLPVVSLAQNCPDGTPANGRICNPLPNEGSVPQLIRTILNGLLTIGMPVVALAVIYCGFLFVFARGNPEKLTKAKDALLWTLIGAAVLLGAWALAQMISATVAGLGS